MRILIVDDNKGLTTIMKAMLEEEGLCRVETAENGENGYKAFLSFRPDIILTDIDMPVKNGLEMVKKIRINQPGIKIIYMSGDMNRYRGAIEREQSEYQAHFIDKPLAFSKIIGMFDEYRNEMRKE